MISNSDSHVCGSFDKELRGLSDKVRSALETLAEGIVADYFSQVNVAVATKLVKLTIPAEKEHKIRSICPSYEQNSAS